MNFVDQFFWYQFTKWAEINKPVLVFSRATHVPIGDDQLQHLELARELCRLFNNTYGDMFPLPKPILGKAVNVKIELACVAGRIVCAKAKFSSRAVRRSGEAEFTCIQYCQLRRLHCRGNQCGNLQSLPWTGTPGVGPGIFHGSCPNGNLYL